jgi:hypothetical protein
MSAPHVERLQMGAGAVLTFKEAARLLPLRDADARRFLWNHNCVRVLEGRRVVVWALVIEALRTAAAPGDDAPDEDELDTRSARLGRVTTRAKRLRIRS